METMKQASELRPGDVIYGADEVLKVYRHHLHSWRVVAETTAGEYSFPEDRTVPGPEWSLR